MAALLVGASASLAELAVEPVGRVETLPAQPSAHWVVVSDLLLRRAAVLDLDRGEFLGMLSTGYMSVSGVFPTERSEFYWPETHYSRGVRGERTDVVTIYDRARLAPVDEVVIPPRRATNVLVSANAALSDDERFLAIHNMTPVTSLTIVDLVERRLAAEIAIPGCALVYAAGDRRFFSLCGDGSWLAVEIDERGAERSKRRGQPFFDPERDPVTEKAVRWNDTWLFVSFEGRVHPVDVSGAELSVGESWSLLGDADREDAWRIGGIQHLAVHQRSGRLYSLMHQGGADTHKEPGTELWIYDLAGRERTRRMELAHPGLSFLSETVSLGPGLEGLWNFVLDFLVPNPGLDQVQVTQDDEPLLVTGSQIGGSLAVYDALTGELLRRVSSGNLTIHTLHAPWGGER
ncbi:MAG: amine dehydrogenase large subunit [Myxococcota bacterium]